MVAGTERLTFPPVVYVPCEQAPANEEQEFVVDLRQTADGRMALLVYSALDRLVNCCDSLEDLAGSMPGIPDAGPLSGGGRLRRGRRPRWRCYGRHVWRSGRPGWRCCGGRDRRRHRRCGHGVGI